MGDQDGDAPMCGGDSPVQEDDLKKEDENSLPIEQHNGAPTLNKGKGRICAFRLGGGRLLAGSR